MILKLILPGCLRAAWEGFFLAFGDCLQVQASSICYFQVAYCEGSFANQARKLGLPVTYVQRDRDKKFAKVFDQTLKAKRVKVIKNPPRSPNTNAFVERVILSIKSEVLNKFVILGEQHLNYLCQESVTYYHACRPHQSLNNEPPTKPKQRGRPKAKRGNIQDEIISLSEIRCHKRLGGLLNSYGRKAA